MKHIIAVLLENEPGALSRVVALFSARSTTMSAITGLSERSIASITPSSSSIVLARSPTPPNASASFTKSGSASM